VAPYAEAVQADAPVAGRAADPAATALGYPRPDAAGTDAAPAQPGAPVDERATNDWATGERATDERPTDERPTDERPTDERPTDEWTADEPTADEPTPGRGLRPRSAIDDFPLWPATERSANERSANERSANERSAAERSAAGRATDERTADGQATGDGAGARRPGAADDHDAAPTNHRTPAVDATPEPTGAAVRTPPAPRDAAADDGDRVWADPQLRRLGGHRPARRSDDAPRQRARRRRPPRSPAAGLAGLLLCALLAAFFGYVSAEPLWLALGRDARATATVTGCTGGGVTERCTALLTGGGTDGATATLVGPDRTAPGRTYQARTLPGGGRIAYVGSTRGLHLRWGLGLGLVLACGVAAGWAGGAARLPSRRARLLAWLASLGAPVALALGIVAAAF
jgi:hypothetical protein